MEVKQFNDPALAHYSYAIVSEGEVALVDPARDPQPYLDFAKAHQASIVAVFETHPHADFISSHLELFEKYGAKIYIHPEAGVSYPHQTMHDGEEVRFGKVAMRAIFTPGHAPDHNSYLLFSNQWKPYAIFTGDALFVGDIGRSDLREGAGQVHMKREELAHRMYQTVNKVFKKLSDDVLVYPAHGAGSLCGKHMRQEVFSTISEEKRSNWAFKVEDEDSFVHTLLKDQPFIPRYFPHAVEINRMGAAPFEESIQSVLRLEEDQPLNSGIPVIDVRSQVFYKRGHMRGAINIQEGEKLETWLGTIIYPDEAFYLVAEDEQQLDRVIRRVAKIGYENNIEAAVVRPGCFQEMSQLLDMEYFRLHPETFTILDVRNVDEVSKGRYFQQAIHIPLSELRERSREIKPDKPIVVHCAGGYRSAIGSSLLSATLLATKVYDLSDDIREFAGMSR